VFIVYRDKRKGLSYYRSGDRWQATRKKLCRFGDFGGWFGLSGLDYNAAQPHFRKTPAEKVKSQTAGLFLRFNYEVES
jgi:hypothetical protein